MIVAIIKGFRADLLHKLDLQCRVYKKDGVLFRVPQITKTGKPSKQNIEVFFPVFPQDRRLCVVNYLKSYERKTAKYHNIGRETHFIHIICYLFMLFIFIYIIYLISFPPLNLMNRFLQQPSPDGSSLFLLQLAWTLLHFKVILFVLLLLPWPRSWCFVS